VLNVSLWGVGVRLPVCALYVYGVYNACICIWYSLPMYMRLGDMSEDLGPWI